MRHHQLFEVPLLALAAALRPRFRPLFFAVSAIVALDYDCVYGAGLGVGWAVPRTITFDLSVGSRSSTSACWSGSAGVCVTSVGRTFRSAVSGRPEGLHYIAGSCRIWPTISPIARQDVRPGDSMPAA